MYKETGKQYFIKNVYPVDAITPPGGITFKGRYAHHAHQTRRGKLLGKTISDMWMIEQTRYFKPA